MVNLESRSALLMEKMGRQKAIACLSAILVMSMPSLERVLGVLRSPTKLMLMCVLADKTSEGVHGGCSAQWRFGIAWSGKTDTQDACKRAANC